MCMIRNQLSELDIQYWPKPQTSAKCFSDSYYKFMANNWDEQYQSQLKLRIVLLDINSQQFYAVEVIFIYSHFPLRFSCD